MKSILGKKQTPTVADLVDIHYQKRFLHTLLLIIVAVLIVQTGYFVFSGAYASAAFNCLIMLSLWLAVWILRKDYYQLASSLTITSSLALLMFSVLVDGLSSATIFWFFVFPVIATFLKGKRDGSIWLLAVVLTLIAVFFASQAGYITTTVIQYSADTFHQLILAIFLVAIFVYFYQDNLDRKTESVASKETKLSEIYTQLQDEIRQREEVAASLDHNLKIIAHQKARNEALLQSIGEGVIAVDKHGIVIMINQVAEQLFNYYNDDVAGKPYKDLFTLHDEDGNPLPPADHPIAQTLENQAHYHAASYFFHNYNNEPVPVSTTTNPVKLEDESIGAIEVFRDITEEHNIAKAKDEFLSLASHQLRTPLGAIRWYAERLLKISRLRGKNRKYLQTIYEDSARMSGLLGDYLNVSRLELGTNRLEITENDLSDLVDKCLKDLQPLIKEKNLKVVKKPNKTTTIHSDTKMLEIIVQNLISNAVKYTPAKGRITILITAYDGKNKALSPGAVLSVEDTGIGIPLPQQRNIFNKLFRADNALRSETEGTGLGLYSVKAAVDKLRGIIWFESQVDKGTHFAVTLPDLEADIINETDEKEK